MPKAPPLSVYEICEHLNIDRKTFFNWIEMKESPACHLYDCWRVSMKKNEKALGKEENKRQK